MVRVRYLFLKIPYLSTVYNKVDDSNTMFVLLLYTKKGQNMLWFPI